ncbi:deiodinase family protein [Planctomycetaceae bacterium SH139]
MRSQIIRSIVLLSCLVPITSGPVVADDANTFQPLSPAASAAADELLTKLQPGSEGRAMLEAILAGSRMGPDSGWFPMAQSQTRFDWSYMEEKYDLNDDNVLSRDELMLAPSQFARIDRDNNSRITAEDFDWSQSLLRDNRGRILFSQADTDSNGKLTSSEFAALFHALDPEGAGYIALDDLAHSFAPPADRSAEQSFGPDRSTLVLGLKRQEIGSLEAGPELNQLAPDFTLRDINGTVVTLSEVNRDRPVVLVFGNFTCGPFRQQSGNIEKLYNRYKDQVAFYLVYVREAHPDDGWMMARNQQAGISLKQPRSDAQRSRVAETCRSHLDLSIPFLVDNIDDQVGITYSGMPNRLYLLDGSGRIAFKNGRGPFGFSVPELEQAIVFLLADMTKR